jgi:hypothetical protein
MHVGSPEALPSGLVGRAYHTLFARATDPAAPATAWRNLATGFVKSVPNSPPNEIE